MYLVCNKCGRERPIWFGKCHVCGETAHTDAPDHEEIKAACVEIRKRRDQQKVNSKYAKKSKTKATQTKTIPTATATRQGLRT